MTMDTTSEIRRARLALLVKSADSVADAARILDRSSSQVSQWLNASIDHKTGKPRHISDASARHIEAQFKKPKGWLDQPLVKGSTPDTPRNWLTPRIRHIVELCEDMTESEQDHIIAMLESERREAEEAVKKLSPRVLRALLDKK